MTQLLISQGINTIIVACHTSSATSLDYLQNKFPQINFIDMLLPTIFAAIKTTKNNHVGIIATHATIKTNIHKNLFKKYDSAITVTCLATPDLVPFIENQQIDSPECFEYIKNFIDYFLEKKIDTLILGCTHYPFITHIIKKIAPQLHLISAADCITQTNTSSEANITFFVSGSMQEFEKKIDTFLPLKKYLLKKFI